MKVSLSDIRYYKDQYKWSDDPAPNGVDDLVQKIGAQLAAVEDVVPFGKSLKGVILSACFSRSSRCNTSEARILSERTNRSM